MMRQSKIAATVDVTATENSRGHESSPLAATPSSQRSVANATRSRTQSRPTVSGPRITPATIVEATPYQFATEQSRVTGDEVPMGNRDGQIAAVNTNIQASPSPINLGDPAPWAAPEPSTVRLPTVQVSHELDGVEWLLGHPDVQTAILEADLPATTAK
ncbi:MAG: hypothetical protein HKN47_03570 [Pirellulaceae bacterium]|nr:hypothetical protein [Pirellulaceae bacterium]